MSIAYPNRKMCYLHLRQEEEGLNHEYFLTPTPRERDEVKPT